MFMSALRKFSLVSISSLMLSLAIMAQAPAPAVSPTPQETPQSRDRVTNNETKTEAKGEQPKTEVQPPVVQAQTEVKKDDAPEMKETPSAEVKTEAAQENKEAKTKGDDDKRQETLSEEEAAILPYYNNYLKEYHLGPEDVISVDVFGQPKYSKAGITVPPTATIGYPLIPGGVFVGGKTTDQIAKEIAKKLDEYIIDPQVTVTLEKVGSARFAILGKVVAPGVRLMTRRYNLYEAVVEAGGVAQGGDNNRVLLVRQNTSGGYSQTVYSIKDLLSGKKEIPYLVPGDQIIVPEKKWSLTKIMETVSKFSAASLLFGRPF